MLITGTASIYDRNALSESMILSGNVQVFTVNQVCCEAGSEEHTMQHCVKGNKFVNNQNHILCAHEVS